MFPLSYMITGLRVGLEVGLDLLRQPLRQLCLPPLLLLL